MAEREYGHTKSGEPVSDAMIEELADEGERGFEPGQLRGRPQSRGRPPLGAAVKTVESVRLEPALRAAAARRAASEGTTISEVIGRALRAYLKSA